VNNYNGGVFSAIPITNAEISLDNSIKQGTKDAKEAIQLSSAGSNSIIATIKNLTHDVETSRQAVESKNSQFTAEGLTSIVQNNLSTIKSDTDDFANALIAIAAADTVSQVNAEKTTIDSDFQAAINDFANQKRN